jgi:hypothetical protein
MVFCSNCGTRAEGRFCYACGSALHAADHGAAEEVAAPAVHAAVALIPSAVAPPPAGPAAWREETRRAWTWWRRGFIWLAVIVSLEVLIAMLGQAAAEERGGAEVAASLIGGFIGLAVVLGLQYAMARWLLGSFERGSSIARRVFQFGFVGLGLVRTLSAFALLGSVIGVMDLFAGLGQLAAWGYAAWLLQQIGHTSTPRQIVREDGTVVRMRTEVPSFVATLAILLIGLVQLGADLVREHH